MTEFADRLGKLGKHVHRVDSSELNHSGDIATILAAQGYKRAVAVDPTDDWLHRRVSEGCRRANIELEWLDDSAFLTPTHFMDEWVQGRQKYFFTDFYIQQRKRLGLLLDDRGKPLGGKWTFDTENRKRLPKSLDVPKTGLPVERPSVRVAKLEVQRRFPMAIGDMANFRYPVTHQDASIWLDEFIRQRLALFGDYEDAISDRHDILFHSVLTPMLNIGLLTPRQIVDAVLARTHEVEQGLHDVPSNSDAIPMNSLEGFLRQVIGWREFVRLVYLHLGRQQRTKNFWNLDRTLPASFYDATTGIVPVDASIRRCLDFGYCHHIERLMILGNFMLLCDLSPNQVYRWFMEMFIDSYDWVMVPNVYGMSQHADGGLMTTKPYISGSSYVLKMSNYPKGPWCETWDALYWRFIHREREFFGANPRMRVMIGQLSRMGNKLDQHLKIADRFLAKLST